MSDLSKEGRGSKSVHPYQHNFPDGSVVYTEGITLREYYAGLALQGLLASRNNPGASKIINQQIVRQSVTFADNLINQLNEKTS